MKFEVNIEDKTTEVEVDDGSITFTEQGIKLLYEDVIGLEKLEDGDNSYNLFYIQESTDYKLIKEKITFTTDNNVFEELQKTITSKIWTVTGRPKKLAIFVNSVGGSFQGKQLCESLVVPVLSLAGIHTDVIASQRPGHATEFAETYDFDSVDGVVIMGGDGTISEICNVLLKSTQKNAGVDLNDQNTQMRTMELPVAIIPTGTRNGLVNAMHGCKDILTSTLHIVKGNKSGCNVLGSYSGGELIGYATFCTGYGLLLDIPRSLIDYRWMGFIRRILVPFYYVLVRPYREINVEITYEYLEGRQPNDISEEEKTSRKVIQNKKITSLMALSYNLDFEYLPDGQHVEKDQFDLLDYQTCGRYSLVKHFYHMGRKLTKDHLIEAKDFVKHSEVTAFRLKILDEDNSTDNELNYFYNIDGEVLKLKVPDVYVKLFPRCFSVFSSYKGSKKWY